MQVTPTLLYLVRFLKWLNHFRVSWYHICFKYYTFLLKFWPFFMSGLALLTFWNIIHIVVWRGVSRWSLLLMERSGTRHVQCNCSPKSCRFRFSKLCPLHSAQNFVLHIVLTPTGHISIKIKNKESCKVRGNSD